MSSWNLTALDEPGTLPASRVAATGPSYSAAESEISGF